MTKRPWTSRASGLGSHIACTYRAAFDRAISEGIAALTPEELAAVVQAKQSSPYADLGTWIHFATQDGMRCTWGDGDSSTHLPSPEQLVNAAALFDGSAERAMAGIRKSAILAASAMPPAPDGKPWIAEAAFELPQLSGHIDFISADGTHIVDLKTTTRPPVGGRCKPAHLVQVLAYAKAMELVTGIRPTKATVLYVDSITAAWAEAVHIDLTQDAVHQHREDVWGYADFLRGPHLYDMAVPNLGEACSDWCPYATICRDRINAGMSAGKPVSLKPVTVRAPIP
jgi:hypothetical protein